MKYILIVTVFPEIFIFMKLTPNAYLHQTEKTALKVAAQIFGKQDGKVKITNPSRMSFKYLGSAFSRQPSSRDLLVKAKTFLITFHQSVLIMQFKSEELRKPPVRSSHLLSFSASEMQPQKRTNAISLTP